jgi:glutamyl-tRNA synthetase
MDIRVGKILTCEKHPDSTKLYSETIDIGNGEIREIGSGLQEFIPLDEMRDAMCIVLTNLKPKKLAGKPSHGMVLCAETHIKDVVELIKPPEGSVPGDLISFEGFERKCPEALNAKKNPWDNVQPKLAIDKDGVAVFENIPFKTDKGVCKSKTIKNGIIH